MKIPSLKEIYEYALRKKNEALKHPEDINGYDKELDQLYQDEEENKSSSDMMIRRIA